MESVAATVVTVAAVGASCLAAFVVAAFLTISNSRTMRESMSIRPLGLRHKKPFKHSVLDVSSFSCYADYVASLTRTSAVKNLKSLESTFAKHRIVVTTRNHSERCLLGWEHYVVIRAHETRVYGPVRATLDAMLRWLAAALMVGTLDEYRIDGVLVAFCIQIVKGATLRSMWFYQKPEASRCRIWFHTKQSTVTRAIATPGVRHVDLGPSLSKDVVALKSLYGFEFRADWQTECDYSGPFRDLKF